ncbi:protein DETOXIFICATION 48-like [Musa acuminata AAA Group]|uniref:protein DETOXIFICATION 48-like n=1 Tax=Musa acuminata AAA Group TaxID=214697 RepID=UPI0031D301F0
MCNTTPSSPTSFPFDTNSHLLSTHKLRMEDLPLEPLDQDLHRCPGLAEAAEEMRAIGKISIPTALTGLVLYSRAMISMLFLGGLGQLELAGGSLSIGFANITGYSVLSGLAMGMEPICGQAFGAKQRKLLGLTLQRTILLLLSASIPIAFLWLNMKRILLWCGQDERISSTAHIFITFAIPDLFFLSVLHPLRIYLRSQNITFPVTYCSLVSVVLHVPLNYLLVVHLKMGIAGVALAMVWTNLNLFICLLLFVLCSGVCKDSWVRPSMDCLRGWSTLLKLAAPSCVSVCLEWWWYEFMVLFSGLLANPKAAVASMGILIQTTSLVYVFPSALSLGVSTRVGNELGANRPAKARTAAVVSLACAVLLGLAAMVFTTSMRHQWGRLFTNDAETLKLTALALPIAGLCELGNCPQTTGCGVLRGSARPTTGANINLGSFYLIGLPVAILLSFVGKMGLPGLWLGLLAAQASCAAIMAYVLAGTDWRMEVERARELTRASNSSPPPPPIAPITADTSGINSVLSPSTSEDKKRAAALEGILCMNGDVKRVSSSETDHLISYV